MTTVVTGLFDSPRQAAIAVQALEAQGVPGEDISLLTGDRFDRDAFTVEPGSKAAEGFGLGAAGGGALGALVAGLTAVGTIATGGAGILIAGPLAAALAGAGAGAATGGVLGGLIGAAMPEHEIKHYEDALEKGSVLVGVTCEADEEQEIAKRTLKGIGAMKVSHA
jgi:hypothetical protein